MRTPKRPRAQGNEAPQLLTPARKAAKTSVNVGGQQQQFQTPKKMTSEAQYRQMQVNQLIPKTPLPALQSRTGNTFTARLA